MTKVDLIKLAVDTYKGTIDGNFSKADSSKALINALIDANGGSSKIDYKAMRRNKGELFEIIEEMVLPIVLEGLNGDEFYMNFVEERRLNDGDTNEFVLEDNSIFVVSELADGVAVARRQRIGEKTTKRIKTHLKGIHMYEELNRVLSGRVDWNHFVDKLIDSYKKNVYHDIYTAFKGVATSSNDLGSSVINVAGTSDEGKILDLVSDVEVALDETAVIFGTKTALRKVKTAQVSDQAKNDYYNAGYFGKVAGVPMIAIKDQRVKGGSQRDKTMDNMLFVIAGNEKFIKLVYEGDGLMMDKDPMTNVDLSQEYLYADSYGVGIAIAGKLGVYTLSE